MAEEAGYSNLSSGEREAQAKRAQSGFWDLDNPRSGIRLCPNSLREAFLSLPEDLQSLSESGWKARYRLLGSARAEANQLRYAFWQEYDRCQHEFDDRMRLVNIIKGIIREDTFEKRILKDHCILSLMLIIPTSYEVAMREAINTGLDRLREIMDLPVVEEDPKTGKKKVNTALANLIMRATAYMDMRANGGITQRLQVEGKTINIDLKADGKEIREVATENAMAILDKKLKQLEAKEAMIEKGMHPGQALLADIVVQSMPIPESRTEENAATGKPEALESILEGASDPRSKDLPLEVVSTVVLEPSTDLVESVETGDAPKF